MAGRHSVKEALSAWDSLLPGHIILDDTSQRPTSGQDPLKEANPSIVIVHFHPPLTPCRSVTFHLDNVEAKEERLGDSEDDLGVLAWGWQR